MRRQRTSRLLDETDDLSDEINAYRTKYHRDPSIVPSVFSPKARAGRAQARTAIRLVLLGRPMPHREPIARRSSRRLLGLRRSRASLDSSPTEE